MSREIKWKKVLKEVNVLEEGDWVCDNCGKHKDIKKHYGTYYSIMSGHREWGNDSCDSIKNLDACSDECLIALVNKWIEKWKGYRTAYIEIQANQLDTIKLEVPNDSRRICTYVPVH